MPAERAEGVPVREWVLLTGLVAGRSMEELAPMKAMSRQACCLVLHRVEERLRRFGKEDWHHGAPTGPVAPSIGRVYSFSGEGGRRRADPSVAGGV